MQNHQFHALANFRAQDLQRQAQHQRMVKAARQEQQRASRKLTKSNRAFRQQGRSAPQH